MRANDPRSDGDLLVASRSDPDAFAVFYRPPLPPHRRVRTHLTALYDSYSPEGGIAFLVGNGFGCCATPADILAGRVFVGPPLHQGSPGLPGPTARFVMIVPAGVVRVRFSSKTGRSISATVHGDVAAAQTRQPYSIAGGLRIEWFDGRGRLVKRIPVG